MSDPRRGIRFPAIGALVFPKHPGLVGELRDVSTLGLSARLSRQLKAASLHEIEFNLPNDGGVIRATAKVVWSNRLTATEFLTGLSWEEIDEDGLGHISGYVADYLSREHHLGA